jgi:hypothetical protein
MRKKILLLLTITMAAIGLFAMSGQTQRPKAPTKNDDATPVRELTVKQRQHSKLYDKSPRSGKPLSDSPSDLNLTITTSWVEVPGDSPSTSTETFLKAATCEAQAIVIGHVQDKTSLLTEDGRFVFTDYQLQVDEVIKDNPEAPIGLGSVATISRPGGAVELNGKAFRLLDKAYQPMEVNGRYLLLLRIIPSTGAYQALNSNASFELKDNKVGRLTKGVLPYSFSYDENAAAFVAQVHYAADRCGGSKVGGSK